MEKTLAESTAVGAVLYINTKDSYKACLNLLIYKSKKLGSIFMEIILSKKNNLIIGCMYRHSCMDIFTFDDHFNPLLDYLSKNANKTTVLLGVFNIKLLNFDKSENISTFWKI